MLRSKPGIVTEAFAVYGPEPLADEIYTAEAFYAASAGFVHDLSLMLRYGR